MRKHKHPIPSPCSSPQRRGDVGSSIFVPQISFRNAGKFSLSHGERRATAGEGVRWLLGAFCILILTACGQGESEAQINSITVFVEKISDNAVTTKPLVYDHDSPISCKGVFEQGGAVQCKTLPNATIDINGIKSKTDKDGIVLIGFDRDAPSTETISVILEDGVKLGSKFVKIAPRKYAISRIDGLPPSQVSTFTKAQLKHIRASSARKNVGFASRQQTMWFKDGFDYPLKDFTKTSPFGAQRILNGESKRPHYGVDIAAPIGTPIYAPADGVVSMADNDLYFEGAMVMLDHGQGLISLYLHMNSIDVKPGQEVLRGEKIGEVGSKGRSTGPHLCWRLKWRNRNLDPELLTKWPTEEHAHD